MSAEASSGHRIESDMREFHGRWCYVLSRVGFAFIALSVTLPVFFLNAMVR